MQTLAKETLFRMRPKILCQRSLEVIHKLFIISVHFDELKKRAICFLLLAVDDNENKFEINLKTLYVLYFTLKSDVIAFKSH